MLKSKPFTYFRKPIQIIPPLAMHSLQAPLTRNESRRARVGRPGFSPAVRLLQSVIGPALLSLAFAATSHGADANPGTAPESSSGAERPNILFIMTDDLGWQDTSVYGSRLYETPHIDRFASEGMLFTDAYAANPLCSPTRASVITGQYPGRLRFTAPTGHSPRVVLDPSENLSGPPDRKATTPGTRTRLPQDAYFTIGEAFKEAGYKTAFMGKWHLGHKPYIPENEGFDFVRGGRYDSGPPAPGKYFSPWRLEGDTLPEVEDGLHIADVLADEAVKYLQSQAQSEEPFFLAYMPYDVHAPFDTKKELRAKYLRKLTGGDYVQESPTMGGMVEVMDTTLGRVFDALDRFGLRENTVVVFYSDNGGNMYNRIDGNVTPTNNAPLRAGKGNNYEGGVRVPLIVRWPGQTQPGSVSRALVSSPDMYPTLLEIAGLPARSGEHVDGHSFAAALRGAPYKRPEPVFSHFPHYFPRPGNIPSTSLREGPWKFYRFWFDGPDQEHRYELYNLESDIGETVNLAEIYPERVDRMDAQVEKILLDTGSLRPRKNPAFGEDEITYTHPRVLYEDRFELQPTVPLMGREPETAHENQAWNARGLTGASEGNAVMLDGQPIGVGTLPIAGAFDPGDVLIITLEVDDHGASGDSWLGLGFSDEPGRMAQLGNYRAWALFRGAGSSSVGRVNAFVQSTNGKQSRVAKEYDPGEPATIRLVYDTSSNAFNFKLNGEVILSRDLPEEISDSIRHAFIQLYRTEDTRLLKMRVEIADPD